MEILGESSLRCRNMLRRPCDNTRCDNNDLELRPRAGGVDEDARQGAERRAVHVCDAFQVDVENPLDRFNLVSQQQELIGNVGDRTRSENTSGNKLLIAGVELRREDG